MNPDTDERRLLATYISHSSSEAFAELVRQNADLVYSAACRQLGDPHLAEDVAQAVFFLLSRKAARVKGPLAGWLVLATHFACRDARKLAIGRQFHERQAAKMKLELIPSPPEPAWESYAPILDSALAALKQKDCDAVALRYLGGLSLKEVAARLGITDKAAEKRVSRAIFRLRQILGAKTTVATVAALTAQIAARAVEAAPARLVETMASSAGSATRNTLAHAIANKAAHTMAMIKIKIAAMVIVAIGVAGAGTGALVKLAGSAPAPTPAAPAVSLNPAAVPIPPARTLYTGPPESQVPGTIQLARWDILFTATGGAMLQQMGTPVASGSAVYRARIVDAAQLRQAVADAAAAGDVAQAPSDMEFAESWAVGSMAHPDTVFTFQPGNSLWIEEMGNLPWIESRSDTRQDTFTERHGIDGIDIHLNHPDLVMNLFEEDPSVAQRYRAFSPLSTPVHGAKIIFNGAIQAGQSLVFIARVHGKFQTYYHLIVWEAFHGDSRKIYCYIGQHDELWWCQGGHEKMRQWTEESVVWDAAARGNWRNGPPSFKRTFDDGLTVQLAALCQPVRWPFCWWDAAGQPSENGQDGMLDLQRNPGGLWAVVDAYGSLAPSIEPSNFISRTIQVPDDPSRQLDVGVAVGPGTQVARLKIGQTTTIDGASYRIANPQSWTDHSFQAQLQCIERSALPPNADYVLRLVAVDNSGKDSKDAYELDGVDLVFGKNPGVGFNGISNFQGMNLKNVAYFRVMRCPRRWVSFTGYATQPAKAPEMNVTTQQVADAQAMRRRLREQESQDQDAANLAADRKTWAAIVPNPATPLGAIRLMLNAARAGDVRTVRRMMVAYNPYLNRLLDIGASYIVLNQQLRAKAISRFGIAAVDAQLGGQPLFADMEMALMETPWTPTADGSALEQETDGVARLRKNSAGHYYLDLDNFPAQVNTLAIVAAQFYCQTLIAHAQPIERLLSSPAVTMDQLKAALQLLPHPPQLAPTTEKFP